MLKTKKAIWLLLLAAFVMAFAGCATTGKSSEQAKETKTFKRFHDIVDVEFVRQYAKFPRPENSLIIDSRPTRKRFDVGYIPMAINIPDSKFAKMTDKLPENKDTLLIFYCQGPK
jgi:hypothetical protein